MAASTCSRPSAAAPFTTDAINRQIKTIGVRAALPFPVHAHMLRHTCGYMRAGKGHSTRHIQDWLPSLAA
jgi:integrase